MAQAERITTAIRELMSRGEPPRSTSPRSAHTEFIAALAGNAPHAIHSQATAEDLERRAEHLQRVFTALHVYVTLIADSAQNFPVVPSIAGTSIASSNNFQQTRWESSAMLRRKCG